MSEWKNEKARKREIERVNARAGEEVSDEEVSEQQSD